MKTEQEIKDKLLDIYSARDSFNKLTKNERKKSRELIIAFEVVDRLYNEKISILNWVLEKDKENEQKRNTPGE